MRKIILGSLCCLIATLFLVEFTGRVTIAQEAEAKDNPKQRPGYLVQIPLPINSKNATVVRQTIQRLMEKLPNAVRADEQPVVVLEFDTDNGKTGRGSKLESCLELARFIASPELKRVRTVAYIPAAKTYVDENLAFEPKTTSQLNGHAVLVAIAANEIAMHRDAAVGNAGADEQNIDNLLREVYRSIARSRLTLPEPMALSMLDPALKLYRVSTDEGVVYVGDGELGELEAKGDVIETKTISQAGKASLFTSKELLDFRLIRHRVTSRIELARAFNLPQNSLEGDPTLGRDWDAATIELPNYIDTKVVEWVTRSINNTDANLIIFKMNSSGGDPSSCLRLARRIAEYDPNSVRTVAFVDGVARGPAALFALSCDHLIMSPASEIGGIPEPDLDPEWIESKRERIVDLAREKGRDWSLMTGVVDLKHEVNRYREKSSGQLRLLSEAEYLTLDEPQQWVLLGPLGLREGVDANLAEQVFIARAITEDDESLRAFYQLEEVPRELTPTMADRWIDKVAKFLASPFVAPWLLFAAVFFISTEMSAPGLGVPGFLGTLCLIAFFWAQYLDGNAHWLEIILFLVGVVFILLEIFALPGFGIFGIGGLLMIVVSVILASQSFVIPKTTAELNRLPISLSMVLAGAMGFFVAVAVLRKVLPNTPYLKRMMLEPPAKHVETGLEGDRDPDAIVDWSYLAGRSGETITPLVPSGKARIDGQVYDVISDGRMIEKSESIVVKEAIGNRIVVMPRDV